MRDEIVFTLTGPDRVGIVEEVTRVFLEMNGNVETSKMARLGGDFAILLLVSLPSGHDTDFDSAFRHLTDQGYKITASKTDPSFGEARPGWQSFRIEVQGADHEGIIHEIAQRLSHAGINIESMETGIARAPESGQPLFRMAALVVVPPSVGETDWMGALAEAAERSGVDVTVTAEAN